MNKILAFLLVVGTVFVPKTSEVVYGLDATSNDPYYTGTSLWNMHGDLLTTNKNAYGSQADEAWYQNYTGSSSVVVGILDSGIQTNHPDLSQNIWVNPREISGNGIDDDKNGYVDDINGWNFDTNTNYWPIDNHGTHVAGTIGAKGGNGVGVAGVNWNVKIVTAKVTGSSGVYDSLVIKAINYFIALKQSGVNVVALNGSWGSTALSVNLRDAIRKAGDAGILFIASAGNAGTDNDVSPNYPSSLDCSTRFDTGVARGYDCIIAVTGINSTGGLNYNYGFNSVDLAAPGGGINSTLPNSTYGSLSGTSMAAPHVTGAVALCYSINPAITPAQVVQSIFTSVTSTPSLLGKVATGGRLNVGDMVAKCLSPSTTAPITTDMTGAPSNLVASVVSDTTINLAWSDVASGESLYRVERGPTCDAFTTVANLAANSTSYQVTGLSAFTSYCFRVTAATSTTSASSNSVSATTLAYVAAPTAFNKKSPSSGTRPYGPGVVLQWYASTNTTRYEYCIATTKAGCTNWTSTDTRLFVSLTLSIGVLYYWQVRAVGSGGITYADSETFWYFSPK